MRFCPFPSQSLMSALSIIAPLGVLSLNGGLDGRLESLRRPKEVFSHTEPHPEDGGRGQG